MVSFFSSFLTLLSAVSALDTAKTCVPQNASIQSNHTKCTIPVSKFEHSTATREKEFKEKFNYASVDCGARILSANKGARELSALLMNAKDKYMVNTCDTKDKYVELEFCQEILVESIVLSNYELFSSVFKYARIYVNHVYPSSFKYSWKLIGEFQAQNKKGKQVFHVKNPAIWAKYLRIEFLTHYGDEYYCLVSQIKVFGQTMMEEVKQDNTLNDDDFMKAIQGQVDKDSQRIQEEDDGVQESFFKNLKKRLSALEESAVFTNDFLKKQRREIRLFLDQLETQQMKILRQFLNNEWIQYADDNCYSKFQEINGEIDDYRRAITEKVEKLDQSISHIKEEVLYYNLLWQILLAIFLFYAPNYLYMLFRHDQKETTTLNVADNVPLSPVDIGSTISKPSTCIQTLPMWKKIKKRKRKIQFGKVS